MANGIPPVNWVDRLRDRAARVGEKRLFTFLDPEGAEEHLGYAGLDRAARAVAARLQARTVPGDRAVLVFPPGLDFVRALFGCLYAGVIPVPAYPPDPARLEKTLPRLQAIVANAGASLVLTTPWIAELSDQLLATAPELGAIPWLGVSGDFTPEEVDAWKPRSPKPEHVAFLQYTSGSTGDPKGVVLTHANLFANCASIERCFGLAKDSVGVSWLPLFHDMGLIGHVFTPLLAEVHSVLMSPLDFLRKPLCWLETVARYGAATSGAPNFAYELCVRKISEADRARLDLRSWKLAYTGAEPVRAETLERFASTFAPQGFSPRAYLPCYGLAESTLLVTSPRLNVGLARIPDPEGVERVGLGTTVDGGELEIVDAERGTRMPDGTMGEIWLRSPSVAQGYWRNPVDTERVFGARLADGEGPYLRTGDLGSIQRGQLVFGGRIKDLIIVRGRNVYPQDLERAAEDAHPLVRRGCSAAFALDVEGEEQVGLALELETRRRSDEPPLPPESFLAVQESIRHRIADEFGVRAHAIFLLAPGALPKTSSGKVQRRRCRELLLDGALQPLTAASPPAESGSGEPDAEAVRRSPSASTVLEYLRQVITLALGAGPDLERPLAAQGLDSLAAIEITHRVERELGAELPSTGFLGDLPLRALAERLALELLQRGEPGVPDAERVELREAPLAPGQEALWFLHQMDPADSAYNLSIAARSTPAIPANALESALARLADRHPSLRGRIEARGAAPSRVIKGNPPVVEVHGAAAWSEEELRAHASRTAAQPFDLANDPPLRVTLYERGPSESLLVLTAHHIASDLQSLAILAEELGLLLSPTPPALPSATPYEHFSRWHASLLQGRRRDALTTFWRERYPTALPELELPTDRPRGQRAGRKGGRVRFRVSAALSQRVAELARRQGATSFAALLASFQVLLARHADQERFVVAVPSSLRERAAFASTVGYLINPIALRADLSEQPSFSRLLERTRGELLGALEHRWLPFSWLVEQLHPTRTSGRPALLQVMFNLERAEGRASSRIAPLLLGAPGARSSLGPFTLEAVELAPTAPQFELSLLLVQDGAGMGGVLDYDAELFDAATVERLAARYVELLEQVCSSPDAPVWQLPMLPRDERALLAQWNATERTVEAETSLDAAIDRQARSTPSAVALVDMTGASLTYDELRLRSDALAGKLASTGVRPGTVVGLCAHRSVELVVAMVAILKTGAAYLPLDPSYPVDRLRFMLEDSQATLLLTGVEQAPLFTGVAVQTLPIAADGFAADERRERSRDPGARTDDALAYLIYTSGSTGRPKGVRVTHRNVTRFFAGMDERLGTGPGTWLAVTSISFDISVLELLWTLARGFTVVVAPEQLRGTPAFPASRPLGFSLFYFADQSSEGAERYRLLMDGARFADDHGFEAVWTPERHFHAFGASYPNPAITSAAIAAVTRNVKIRAGSVVLPLHDPLRVAEEWAAVDNLSGGRVGVSVAAGWNPADFVLQPDIFDQRRQSMLEQIGTVQRLWRGEAIQRRDPSGALREVKTYPTPLQKELPLWLTAAGSPQTFEDAGRMGANVLTHLLGQGLEAVREKVAKYRSARAATGRDPATGRVTLMVHAFAGDDPAKVRETVREPLMNYLRSSAELMKGLAASVNVDPSRLSEAEVAALVENAFDRYVDSSGVIGTPESCAARLREIAAAGVDEVAFLVDFGVAREAVMSSLEKLAALRTEFQGPAAGSETSLADELVRHEVTHLQCTPTLAQLILASSGGRAALGRLQRMLVGGEAFPAALATQLKACVGGELHNMYGPTETTVWSTTHRVEDVGSSVSLGRPIANTQLHVLDRFGGPAPIGVPGELYIGGAGVTLGYHAREDLTRERFVPDPHSPHESARMYRTGDVVRWRTDGTLEFHGRVDHQVKLRGHRIELGEIEAALAAATGVREAVVLARTQATGDGYLVAYLIGAEPRPSAAVLRAQLATSLPEFMIPSTFVWMEAYPLTPNGKIDRKAFPDPGSRTVPLERELVPPRTALEEVLAALWGDLLGIEEIGVHHDFFELGGHSLLAARLTAALREALQVELPVQEVFRSRTIDALAAHLRRLPSASETLKAAELLLEVSAMSEESAAEMLDERAVGRQDGAE